MVYGKENDLKPNFSLITVNRKRIESILEVWISRLRGSSFFGRLETTITIVKPRPYRECLSLLYYLDKYLFVVLIINLTWGTCYQWGISTRRPFIECSSMNLMYLGETEELRTERIKPRRIEYGTEILEKWWLLK